MLKEEQTLKKKEALEKFISSKSMYNFLIGRPLLGSCQNGPTGKFCRLAQREPP